MAAATLLPRAAPWAPPDPSPVPYLPTPAPVPRPPPRPRPAGETLRGAPTSAGHWSYAVALALFRHLAVRAPPSPRGPAPACLLHLAASLLTRQHAHVVDSAHAAEPPRRWPARARDGVPAQPHLTARPHRRRCGGRRGVLPTGHRCPRRVPACRYRLCAPVDGVFWYT
jgi:hypothetical protein